MFDHQLDIPPDAPLDARSLPAHGGVYLITDESDRPILLAACESLRRVVLNRLAAPPPDKQSKRANLAQIARRVQWRATFSRFETAWAHWQAAREFDPKGYRKLLAFGPAWFLAANLETPAPRLVAVKELRGEPARHVGPFATRRGAEDWRHLLEDAFDLCRYHHVLEQAPDGQPCAYFDMGRCPAPCSGRVSLDAYRRTMADAMNFTAGHYQARLAALRATMEAAAKSLEYERAASIKQTIERVSAALERPQYKYVADLRECRWLVIQRGGPARRSEATTLVKPFYFRQGWIEAGEPAAISELAAVLPQWLARCETDEAATPAADRTAQSEGLWLVGKFLLQEERACGLFYRMDRLPEIAVLLLAIQERFTVGKDEEEGSAEMTGQETGPTGT
jgi:hypothetical protein